MLINIAQTQLFLLALTRVLAMLIQIPVLGGQMIPLQVRLGFGLLLTAILIPWGPLPPESAALGILPLAGAVLRELIIGSLAGFAAALTFATIQVAGETMSMGAGFSAGRILNPTLGESGSAMDQLFVMVALLLFLVIDGHHSFIIAMQRSFEVLPINQALPPFTDQRMVQLFGQVVVTGVQMALPVMAALLITDLTLGLLARVAPNIQVFFLGLPLKVGVGLIALALLFSIVAPMLTEMLGTIGERMLYLLGG